MSQTSEWMEKGGIAAAVTLALAGAKGLFRAGADRAELRGRLDAAERTIAEIPSMRRDLGETRENVAKILGILEGTRACERCGKAGRR